MMEYFYLGTNDPFLIKLYFYLKFRHFFFFKSLLATATFALIVVRDFSVDNPGYYCRR